MRIILFLILFFPSLAFAQNQRNPCFYDSASPSNVSGQALGNGCVPVDNAAAPLPISPAGSYNNITTDTTTLVKGSRGILRSVCLNTPVATETIKLYDGLSASGTLFATITIPANPQPSCLIYDMIFSTGLTIVTAVAASDITISYK